VEDSVFMRVCANKNGVLGNDEWFCPICTKDDPARVYKKGDRCQKHPDIELKETAYVHTVGKDVKARFARDEIIHGIQDAWLPGLYGNTKLVSCLRILMDIIAMDQWNLETYTEGKLAQILVFKGMTQSDVNELLTAAKAQKDKQETDPVTGDTKRKLRTLGLGSKDDVTKVDAMPPSEKMQNLDWWKLWREVICSMYGVTPVFVGIVESGKTGNNPRMQIDVQNNTTEQYQLAIEEPFNETLLPKLGVTDWLFKFNPIESKDEMQEITVLKTKVETVIEASRAGFQAELTDEGEVKISGKPNPPQPIPPQLTGQTPQGQDATPFSPEKVFAQEKSHKTYLVKEYE
jgi:hypothetical protein